MNQTINDIKSQCQLHEGNYVLLCYERKTKTSQRLPSHES